MTTARNKPIGRYYELQQEVETPEPYVLTSKITIKPPTRRQMLSLRAARTDDEIEAAILGEHGDAVFALFADRPNTEWTKFINELYERFYGPGVGEVPGKADESSG